MNDRWKERGLEMAKGSSIVVADQKDIASYDVLADGVEQIRAIIQANIGTTEIGVFDLPRAINPSGSGSKWEIPGLGDEAETVGTVEGIIVYHDEDRSYWAKSYYETGGGEQPDCRGAKDENGVWHGTGTPGGICVKCPNSEFTKDSEGNTVPPRCPVFRKVFLLRPNQMMPTMFTARGGNAQQVSQYLMKLTFQGKLPAHHCITQMKMESTKYKSGRDWKKWNLSFVAELPDEAKAQMDDFNKMLRPMLEKVEVTQAEVQGKDEEPF